MAPFPLDKAELVSLFVESVLAGIFAVLFVTTIYVLLQRRSNGRLNKPMFIAAIAMFVIVQLHVSFNFARMVDAFITYRDNNGTIAYLGDQPRAKNMVKSTLLNIQISLGDSLLAYRCWIVWRSWKIVALPAALAVGSVVTGVGVLVGLHNLGSGGAVFRVDLSHWIYGELIVTFLNNVICTALIAYKIYSVERRAHSRVEGRSLVPLIRILAESGALAAAASMTTLICYAAGSNSQIIVLDSMAPISAIAFTLIIVRAGLVSTFESSTGPSGRHHPISRGADHTTATAVSRNNYPLQPVAVQITRVQHTDTGSMDKIESHSPSSTYGESFLPNASGKDSHKWNSDLDD
ncbi:hypothetical protein SISSUDRAFT_1058683 [Sistotremastrum suecicum HHB10207 ss-3]|uniref:Uncharacterized protein n=1 Tax=Sistotremastrum suecicum HHB10207 ss-3 TaxID=1314776 RepID=A0A166H496_9AGAM|nr:hypothetical protein SISSUDRAFT_1058683 [Sistotremastrum suecicum HHB10207 ss-3]